MTMIQEAYCSYEVCKLLKEKGFEAYTHLVYKLPSQLFHMDEESLVRNDNGITKGDCIEILAPTHQMACAWLREEKNIHIDIYYLPIHRKYMWSIVETKDPKGAGSKELYEEAVEAALKYTLENLL